MTHTFAILDISATAFEEISQKLKDADYGHAFTSVDGQVAIDMHGIGVRAVGRIELEDPGRNATLQYLIDNHACRMISKHRFPGPGREWWIGKLLHPLPHPFESETHCFHEKTPGRETVHFLNSSDVGLYAVLAYVLNGNQTVNPKWIESIAASDASAAAEDPRAER